MIEKQKYTDMYYWTLFYSAVSLNPGVSYEKMVQDSNALASQYGVPSFYFSNMSFGMAILHTESATVIFILKILSAAMIFFTLFCLFANFINKINRNLRTYAIHIMNGGSVPYIAIPMIIEMIVLLLPALLFNYGAFRERMDEFGTYTPILFVCAMAATVVLLMSCFLVVRLKKVDIESLMRRRE